FGLPGCGRGVTVPTSTKPNPSCDRPQMASPFLSRPAASPTGLGNSSPITRTGSLVGALASRPLSPSLPPAPIRSRESSWEVSGVNLNSNWRASLYIRNLEFWKEWRRSIAVARVFQRCRKHLETVEFRHSGQAAQRNQLALIAKFHFKGTKHTFACQKRAQV